jgi:hypothetical protein
MSNNNSTNVAFLVVSCDKYKDLWEPFFKTFFKFWKDCTYKLYLASNYEEYPDEKVTNISFGEDKDYSTNLINILKEIEEEWVIVWFEDAFITKTINNNLIENLINEAISKKIDYLKLTVDYPLYYGIKSENFGPIPRGVKYRSAMGMALYHKSTLNKILLPGQSAWQLDISNAADELDIEFYTLNSKYRFNRPVSIINSVIKGKWYKTAPAFLKKVGLKNFIPNREVQPLKDYLYIKLFILRVEIYFILKKHWYN